MSVEVAAPVVGPAHQLEQVFDVARADVDHHVVHALQELLQLRELPRAKVLGIVNFPTFRAAMAAAQHIVKLGPTAVELVDRTMIELSLQNPAFAPTVRTALIGQPDAPYPGLALVKQACTSASLGDFAWDLYEAWSLAGGSAKNDWAFTALGLLGDERERHYQQRFFAAEAALVGHAYLVAFDC